MAAQMEINFLHRKTLDNVGDYWSCPSHYYKDFSNQKIFDIKKFKDSDLNSKALIIGGGGLLGAKTFDKTMRKISKWKNKKVLWAVGDNVHTSKCNPNFLDYVFDYDVVGIRDYIKGYEKYWLPCVSCKHPVFDKYISNKIIHKYVYFEHYGFPFKTDIKEKYPAPCMSNAGTNIEEKIYFLSRSEYVFTNTYHGAYWALLLGKKVICTDWSSKFNNMKHSPVVCAEDKFFDSMQYATSYNILSDYRNLNDIFFNNVKKYFHS